MCPDPNITTYGSYPGPANRLQTGSNTGANATRQNTLLASNPSSPQTEEAVRQFMLDVYDSWLKCIMSPFYKLNQPVSSPTFRQRVAQAAKRYL